MLIDVKVPQLSESVAEATLVSWHKQEGQAVARDENLIDIETDKVVLELPAPEDGVLVKILKGNGETVVAGEVIAQLDTEAKAAGPLLRRLCQRRQPRPCARAGRCRARRSRRAQADGREGPRCRFRRRLRPRRPRHQGRRAGSRPASRRSSPL
jgi:pyruvate/2-oxoglutarate dehydrogenase complex dihydrolipoamide acyltransferase (E2) component